MTDFGFDILYEDGPVLAVCKPPGVATQAPMGIDSLEHRVRQVLKARENREKVYLGIPHRLDRPTSGVIVFCRHSRAAHRLSKQFERREIGKVYWALVEGRVEPAEGVWTDYLRKIPELPRGEIVAQDHPEARLAVLRYRTLGTGPWGTWLEMQPETGRMHQIRIQAASRGHFVLGDSMYGSATAFGPQHEDERLRAIALHARSLSFIHPMTKQLVTVTADPPNDWAGWILIPTAPAWHST